MSTYAQRYAASPAGVPNPYHARVNPWRGGDYNEGNLYHGPNYDEPMFTMPVQPNPIWQSGPPGTAGIGEYSMYDVNTRGGSFSPKGYGGGIFNLNTALGAEGPILIWGIQNNAFISVQTKMNLVLALNGSSPIAPSGILDDTFCAACRFLVMIPGQFQKFLDSLTKDELDMAANATGQCFAAGLLDPALLPCGFPGSTNPNCGSQPNPPNPQTACPPGMNWNAQFGVCVPGGIVPPQPQTSCPAGSTLFNGLCIPSGVIPPIPSACPAGQIPNPLIPGSCIPIPQPQTSCPAGSTLVGGVCIPNGVIPPTPTTTCPAGQVWDPVAKACMKSTITPPIGTCPPGQKLNANGQCVPDTTPATPAKAADNTLLYLGLGVVAVGVTAYFMTRKAK